MGLGSDPGACHSQACHSLLPLTDPVEEVFRNYMAEIENHDFKALMFTLDTKENASDFLHSSLINNVILFPRFLVSPG